LSSVIYPAEENSLEVLHQSSSESPARFFPNRFLFSTYHKVRLSPLSLRWTDLHDNIDGHISLALKPLTFANVFGTHTYHLDYVAEATRVTDTSDPLHQMALGIQNASDRIRYCLPPSQATKVIDGLFAEVELQRKDVLVPFAWNLSMYCNPPVNWNPAESFVSSFDADMQSVRKEAEEQVALEDAGGVINKDMTLANIGDYVICVSNPSDPLKRPFWVGQVTKNYPTQSELRVHWLLPPTRFAARNGKGNKGNSRGLGRHGG
jgi:hypothetical protein